MGAQKIDDLDGENLDPYLLSKFEGFV